MFHCFHSISSNNWEFSISLKHTERWEWILQNLMTDESHPLIFKHSSSPKDGNERWNPPSQYLPFWSFSLLLALIPPCERVKAPTESHKWWPYWSRDAVSPQCPGCLWRAQGFRSLISKTALTCFPNHTIPISLSSPPIGTTHLVNKYLLNVSYASDTRWLTDQFPKIIYK